MHTSSKVVSRNMFVRTVLVRRPPGQALIFFKRFKHFAQPAAGLISTSGLSGTAKIPMCSISLLSPRLQNLTF